MCLWEFHPAGPAGPAIFGGRPGHHARHAGACSFHIRACATDRSRPRAAREYSDPARGARPARAAGVCSPRLVVTFSLSAFAARRGWAARTQISGPLGPVRFHVSGSLFSGFGTQGCPWPCCMRRCYQDSLSMHHGTLSRLPGVACARSSGEVSRSPHTSLTTRQSRGVRRGTAREDVSQPSLLTLPQTATLTPSMGTVSSVAARLLCGRGDQIERLHGPFQRRLQVFVPILLKCGAKDGEDGGLPLSVCCGYRPNHGRACSLS